MADGQFAFFDIYEESEEEWFDRFKKEIKEKLLESYRNGQKAERQGAIVFAMGLVFQF